LSGWVEVPALGRPIHPGMLYDCCSESFTPDFLCDSDNKIKRKISLPTSFLSGLVDVGGAAEYLNHPLLHKGDYVTLHYKRTTRLDQLTFFLLEKVRCPEVIQQQTSTHMVMAVTYGTQAFIVCKTNRTWTMSKVINKLKKMIQLLTAEDGAAQLATSSGLTCTYYGDLETNRGDREITDLSESFPKLLGLSGEKAVPLRVWLCPLKNLYPAATCVREISEDLQSRVEREMEHYRYTGTRCEEMVKHEWVSKVQDLKDKLIRFIDLIQQYLAQLQKLMGRMLVSVRSEVQEEKAVEEEMKGHDLSPFRMEATGQWLDDKQAELKFLESLDSKIRSKMVSTDQLQKVISNSKTDTVVCFTLTSLGETDLYLSSSILTPYRHTHRPGLATATSTLNPGSTRAFLDFVKVTKKLKFVATSIPNDSTPGASIRLYQGGRLVDSDYEAVSKPETVKVVDTEQTDVTLDPDTAHCELILSDNGRRMTVGKNRKVPNNPQRFDGWACILGKEGFRSGRHFWHVEVNIEVEASWAVGVTRSLLKGKDVNLLVVPPYVSSRPTSPVSYEYQAWFPRCSFLLFPVLVLYYSQCLIRRNNIQQYFFHSMRYAFC
uniref:B30.2/SPRY domain-containing protein n=1 Tax=Oncorhynchus kisutch TaxID=8019 RepID=A0A8C7L6B2_ONCKI